MLMRRLRTCLGVIAVTVAGAVPAAAQRFSFEHSFDVSGAVSP
jgi:hypothetical protein